MIFIYSISLFSYIHIFIISTDSNANYLIHIIPMSYSFIVHSTHNVFLVFFLSKTCILWTIKGVIAITQRYFLLYKKPPSNKPSLLVC